jgi:RNA polymerase-binding transcription factor DksA
MPSVLRSPFDEFRLAAWRRRLETMRRSVLDDLAGLAEEAFADETPGSADPTPVAQPQPLALEEQANEREILALIDAAIARIDGRGVPFGICERTGKPIEAERLELVPWTPYSAEGARLAEAI